MEKIIDHFSISTSPRLLLAAIDRMATKNGYSVYDELPSGLRVQLPYTHVRIRNDEKEFELRAKPSIPKLWLILPLIVVTAGVLLQQPIALILCLVLASQVFVFIKKATIKNSEAEIDAFRDKLFEVVHLERTTSGGNRLM